MNSEVAPQKYFYYGPTFGSDSSVSSLTVILGVFTIFVAIFFASLLSYKLFYLRNVLEFRIFNPITENADIINKFVISATQGVFLALIAGVTLYSAWSGVIPVAFNRFFNTTTMGSFAMSATLILTISFVASVFVTFLPFYALMAMASVPMLLVLYAALFGSTAGTVTGLVLLLTMLSVFTTALIILGYVLNGRSINDVSKLFKKHFIPIFAFIFATTFAKAFMNQLLFEIRPADLGIYQLLLYALVSYWIFAVSQGIISAFVSSYVFNSLMGKDGLLITAFKAIYSVFDIICYISLIISLARTALLGLKILRRKTSDKLKDYSFFTLIMTIIFHVVDTLLANFTNAVEIFGSAFIVHAAIYNTKSIKDTTPKARRNFNVLTLFFFALIVSALLTCLAILISYDLYLPYENTLYGILVSLFETIRNVPAEQLSRIMVASSLASSVFFGFITAFTSGVIAVDCFNKETSAINAYYKISNEKMPAADGHYVDDIISEHGLPNFDKVAADEKKIN